MNQEAKAETVSFSVKGQVVIPRRLRKQFEIEEGTRAYVIATPEGILLRPVTAATIRRLRGLLKQSPGAKSLAETIADHQREEKELEEASHARLTRAR